MKLSVVVFSLAVIAVMGCASKGTVESSTARQQLEDRLNARIGKANKQDLVQEFGPANWCREEDGLEKCRFYKKLDTKWQGEKKDRVHRETYDEVIADFDSKGVLKAFQASAQR